MKRDKLKAWTDDPICVKGFVCFFSFFPITANASYFFPIPLPLFFFFYFSNQLFLGDSLPPPPPPPPVCVRIGQLRRTSIFISR